MVHNSWMRCYTSRHFSLIRLIKKAVLQSRTMGLENQMYIYRYGSVGRSIKPFFTFTEQWQKEDIVMKHTTTHHSYYQSWTGRLPNSSADTHVMSSQAWKLHLVQRKKWTIGYSFRPSISSAVTCPANSPIGFLSALEILLITDGTLKPMFWSKGCFILCEHFEITNNRRDLNRR